jgi:hypothetical protein
MSIFNPSVTLRDRNPLRLWRQAKGRNTTNLKASARTAAATFLSSENHFLEVTSLERKRAERSGKYSMLMLLAGERFFRTCESAVTRVNAALAESIRETDLTGWYRQDSTVGVIFTEVNVESADSIREILQAKVGAALQAKLTTEEIEMIQVSTRMIPTSPVDSARQPTNGRLLTETEPELHEAGNLAASEEVKVVV